MVHHRAGGVRVVGEGDPTESRLQHLRRSLAVAAAVCGLYLPIDASHPRSASIVAWRVAWIAVLAAAACVQSPRHPRRAALATYLAAGLSGVASLAIFRLAGGSAHAAFGFVLALPLAVQVIVPELPGAALLTGVVTALGGTWLLSAEGRPPRDVAEWALVSVALSTLAGLGAMGFRRVWLAELRAERDHAAAMGHLARTEQLAVVGRLAAGVAHEINNPLSSVGSNVEFARRQLEADGRATKEVLEALRDAEDGARRVARVVGDLKIVGRTPALEPARPVDLRKVLEAAVTLSREEIRRRGRLLVELREVPPVHGDDGRLGQVFLNLLASAAWALPPGDADAHAVTVRLRQDGSHALVEVSDTGPGLEPERLGRVFEPAFEATDLGALGLGLSTSRIMVEALGGTIVARSALGSGTTFAVTLPLATTAEA